MSKVGSTLEIYIVCGKRVGKHRSGTRDFHSASHHRQMRLSLPDREEVWHVFVVFLFRSRWQNAWSSDTASSSVRDLGIPKRKQSAKFSRLSAMMQWGSLKLNSGSIALWADGDQRCGRLSLCRDADVTDKVRTSIMEDRRLTVREIADEVPQSRS
jgi:hypothetical protein